MLNHADFSGVSVPTILWLGPAVLQFLAAGRQFASNVAAATSSMRHRWEMASDEPRMLGGKAVWALQERKNVGVTRAFRAVSSEEYRDICTAGKFRQGPNSLEGKWFADSLNGARAHGAALYPDGNFVLIEADLPDDVPSFFWLPNLDNKGPARYLSIDDLDGVLPRRAEEHK